MRVADGKKRFALTRWEFIGGAIATALFEERERAIVHDQVFLEKFLGCAKPFREQAPETFAADLAAMTVEAGNRTSRMRVWWTIDLGFDAEPIADSSDLTERDAGLRHAERAGIHSEE